ncbi:MAG: hypothetical protein MJ191_07275, partial [Clostridium sp.]|nr:hypothetical protein [Clostridium sp.]
SVGTSIESRETMGYGIIKNINGAFTVDSEFTDLDKAKVKFHDVCKNLWNASDVLEATVVLVNDKMATIGNYSEYITHEPKVETPTEE